MVRRAAAQRRGAVKRVQQTGGPRRGHKNTLPDRAVKCVPGKSSALINTLKSFLELHFLITEHALAVFVKKYPKFRAPITSPYFRRQEMYDGLVVEIMASDFFYLERKAFKIAPNCI